MICYRDMTFCSTDCANLECPRNFTEEEEALATLWGGINAPVAFSDFSESCGKYVEPEESYES